MKLSEVRQLLAERNIRLTKSLGQNFLHDHNQLQRIIKLADLGPSDRVLEIGPGLGALTELLLPRVAQVLAIEKDRRLCEVLQGRLGHQSGLSLVHEDALEYLKETRRDWEGWKMVSNLPYSVGSPILVELAGNKQPPERVVVTVQAEVGERLVATPGNKDYGVLSLLVQLRYESTETFKIPPACFYPPPDVGSMCVLLVRRSDDLLREADYRIFVQLIKRSFSQRRKMMLKVLKEDWPPEVLRAAFEHLHLPAGVRAEEVGLDEFVALTRFLGSDLSQAGNKTGQS